MLRPSNGLCPQCWICSSGALESAVYEDAPRDLTNSQTFASEITADMALRSIRHHLANTSEPYVYKAQAPMHFSAHHHTIFILLLRASSFI